jgi:hypothetical protein
MTVNGNRKEFLNSGILGGGAGVADRRGFRAILTEYITSPDYDPKYFETFPTSWAAAYAFRKVLDLPVKPGSVIDGGAFVEEVSEAIEEWVTLFLLHYFGVVYLSEFKQSELQQDYDRDLWLALSGTYPSVREEAPRSIKLLQHDDTVVGAYYPAVIFFPARDRNTWLQDKTLGDYLLDDRLSWTRSRRILLTTEKEEHDFHTHLRSIAQHAMPSRSLQDRLYSFCEANFNGRIDTTANLDSNPSKWEVPGLRNWPSDELLKIYPLVKPNKETAEGVDESAGRTFYLVNGLPEYSPWMKTAIVTSGPAPYQYRKVSDRKIVVDLPGRRFECDLGEHDRIVLLKDLFLPDAAHWCKIPKGSEHHAAHIKALHKIDLRDPVVTEKDQAICLAPIGSEMLEHFPDLLRETDRIKIVPSIEGSSVKWSIPIKNREVIWQSRPSYAKGLASSSLALWPPKVSSEWRLYAAFGVGPKEDSGRWHLVDQNGRLGKLIDVEEEEYVSVLYGSPIPNQPRGLVLIDSNERERGVLFLADFGGDQTPNHDLETKLSVDFGTSNTSLAYSFNNGQPETLRFQLTPRPIWGLRRDIQNLEQPGFFPYKWSATTTKGFYPTILLSRRSDQKLTDELEPEQVSLDHLFKVDIPGLHKDLEQRLYEGSLNATWKSHANLKWDLEGRTEPWRTLFLELTLLYAHADLFFDKRAVVDHYVFTFPLAFRKDDRENFHTKVKNALKQMRYYCYGASLMSSVNYDDRVDESTAIAESIGYGGGQKATMEVFIDVGGGTCDIAVSHDRRFLVLDSLRVAGKTFFQFAKKNFNDELQGSVQFRKHLGKLLQGANDSELKLVNPDPTFGLDITYSVWISGLDDRQFKEREAAILRKGMGTYSYQRYRTRLFFRHLIAYSLLQGCAAVVDQKIKLSSGINLILGGNGWGLMLFGEFERMSDRLKEEAQTILKTLKAQLLDHVTEEERSYLEALKIASLILLNEENLSKAKTNVALGALNADRVRGAGERGATMPYTGVTLEDLQLSGSSPATIRWCDRWGVTSFKEKFPGVEQVEDGTFFLPDDLEKPFNSVLSAFTCIGNVRHQDQDNMPTTAWTTINGRLGDFVSSLRGNVERLEVSPINHFLSEVLYSKKAANDYLDTLAEVNGNYKSNSREEQGR